MKTTINGLPSFGYLDVDLEPGEEILCEAGAMASMSADLDMTVSLNGSFFSALMKKLFGDESFFISSFKNNSDTTSRLTLTQDVPGEISELELENETICLQPGAYIASNEGIKLGIQWAGFVSFIAREGLFRLTATGPGKIWFGAYGGILTREVSGEYIVDTGHLLAYPPEIKLHLRMAGGIFSSFFSGEGLVTKLRGNGKVYLQSRSLSGLAGWINPKLWG